MKNAPCRALTLADYPAARRLYADLHRDHAMPDFDEGLDQFAQVISHDGTWIIGADHEGDLVSMATLHVLPNMTYQMKPYALVENVVTRSDHQRQGFGRLVIEALTRKAWAEGAYKIMLLTNRERGTRAFYERLGFLASEKDGLILRRPDEI